MTNFWHADLGGIIARACGVAHLVMSSPHLVAWLRGYDARAPELSRDFARSCQTPVLVMPQGTPAHPYQTSVDIASLAPNAEVTVYPWREPPELKERTINRVRMFLKAHQPVTASR